MATLIMTGMLVFVMYGLSLISYISEQSILEELVIED